MTLFPTLAAHWQACPLSTTAGNDERPIQNQIGTSPALHALVARPPAL